MKSLKFIPILALAISVMAIGCQDKAIQENAEEISVHKVNKNHTPAMVKHQPFMWEDCMAYGTVATPTSFEPEQGPFDKLFVIENGFKDGLGHISDAAPGDQDYNGGRWAVYVLKNGVDAAIYDEACSVDDLNMDDFEKNGVYFECPVIPLRGNRNGLPNNNNGNGN